MNLIMWSRFAESEEDNTNAISSKCPSRDGKSESASFIAADVIRAVEY